MSTPIHEVVYDPRAGQYRRKGRFIPRVEVLRLVDEERSRTEVRLMATVRRYASGSLSLREWEAEFAQVMKSAHIRMAALAAGGTSGLTPSHLGVVGANLKEQYHKHLAGFAEAMADDPTFTLEKALNRARLYGQSIAQSFHDSEKVTRKLEGRRWAKRVLDSSAEHCLHCPTYATAEYVPIAEIVPPGTNCQCRGRCRCRILYLY